jgi:hypothetical protein
MIEPGESSWKSRIPRNLLAVSLGSLFTDISSETIVSLLPLFITNVLGAKTAVVGLIEGVAESTASLTRLISEWLSDKLGKRKALTVFGYSLSTVVKPLYLLAGTWPAVLLLRFADRLGKGIRTALRDALVADSIKADNRGFGFGLHRAADTLGATIGLAVAAAVTYAAGPSAVILRSETFHLVIWISILPSILGVLSLILIARDMPAPAKQTTAGQVPGMRPQAKPRLSPRLVGFFIMVVLFTLGNSSGSFLVLRSQNLGLNVFHVMSALLLFHALYTIVSTPACVPIGSDGGGCCSWAG